MSEHKTAMAAFNWAAASFDKARMNCQQGSYNHVPQHMREEALASFSSSASTLLGLTKAMWAETGDAAIRQALAAGVSRRLVDVASDISDAGAYEVLELQKDTGLRLFEFLMDAREQVSLPLDLATDIQKSADILNGRIAEHERLRKAFRAQGYPPAGERHDSLSRIAAANLDGMAQRFKSPAP